MTCEIIIDVVRREFRYEFVETTNRVRHRLHANATAKEQQNETHCRKLDASSPIIPIEAARK